MVKCKVCDKSIAFGGRRFKLKDGSILCNSCHDEYLEQKERQQEALQKKLEPKKREAYMESIGYYKHSMCPFTQVNVGGTKNIATVALGGPSINEYTWTHGECIQEYCAIWDEKNKRCSIRTIALQRTH
jgi:hypothetical protein